MTTWLDRDAPLQTVALGGTAALSDAVVAALPNPRRVAGPDRTATAAAGAVGLWDLPGGPAHPTVVNGYRADGWSYALVAAGLAADALAPTLLVDTEHIPEPTAALVAACPAPSLRIVGPTSHISTATDAALHDLAAGACD